LSPADEMKTFVMPPGYRVELVASEPLIQDPILIDWDPDGRLWAIEMPSYMRDMTGSDEKSPSGRIVVLEDTNDDGVMDKRTVFADGLVLPRALKVLDHGVLVAEPPNLWLMHDTNGDLKADSKDLVTDQYGRRDANVEHNANGLLWALDNWMHTSETNIYLRLKDAKFETAKTLPRGQWAGSQDDAGRIYRNTNESVLHVDVVPTPYYTRNPFMARTRGSYESLEGEDRQVNTVWPAHATPAVNRGYQNGILRSDATLAAYTSANSPLVYRGDRLPHDLYGSVFIAEPAGNLIGRVIVEDDGVEFEPKRAYPKGEFLASSDERFRPVHLSNAPDGTLYIVDMYRGIIEHRGYVTEYLRDQIIARKLEQPTGLGRIYRVMHDSTRRAEKPSLGNAAPAQLIAALSHPNGWWRDTAQRLLVERADRSVVPDLIAIADQTQDVRARLHALWTLDGLDSLTPSLVVKALNDASRDVRASGLRLAERWLTESDPAVEQAVIARLDDQDWIVKAQAAASIGALRDPGREHAVTILLERYGDEPVTLDAAISSARGIEIGVIERLMDASPDRAPELEAAMTTLAATVIRSGEDVPAQRLFNWIAQGSRPEWQRTALLAGGESALLSAPLPGSAPSRTQAASAACPTCPGARGGPGGARAFNGAEPDSSANRAGPMIRLASQPVGFVALSSGSSALSVRAAKVLARVSWTGKPGAAEAPAALSSAEQERFNAGEDVYKNLCQACHQADGTGQERLGANLVGSALATGTAETAARVLLHGKEGSIGLMPPLGSVLTDDQIAAALTFVRRSWGNSASAVSPDTIKQVRAQTSGRTRPWTDAELGK
jgi:mono/diheme cytochrome c family protein/glucose/arabinose dehydrogenase